MQAVQFVAVNTMEEDKMQTLRPKPQVRPAGLPRCLWKSMSGDLNRGPTPEEVVRLKREEAKYNGVVQAVRTTGDMSIEEAKAIAVKIQIRAAELKERAAKLKARPPKLRPAKVSA